MHSYCFMTRQRGELEQYISSLVPIKDNRVFLLSTGAETTECAIKLARTYGYNKYGKEKIKLLVSRMRSMEELWDLQMAALRGAKMDRQ